MSLISEIVNKIFHPQQASAETVTPPMAAPEAAPAVDISQVLSDMAQKRGGKLNWQTSIVDLLKLLDLDSSLSARQQLAKELHFEGDVHDSASMNVWLQDQVMRKLKENGGHVPQEFLH